LETLAAMLHHRCGDFAYYILEIIVLGDVHGPIESGKIGRNF